MDGWSGLDCVVTWGDSLMSPDPYHAYTPTRPRPRARNRNDVNECVTSGTTSHTRSHGCLGVEHRIDPARGETRARAEARRHSRRRRPKSTLYDSTSPNSRSLDRSIARSNESNRDLDRRRDSIDREMTSSTLDVIVLDVLVDRSSRSRRRRRRVRSFIDRHPWRYGRIDAKGPRL